MRLTVASLVDTPPAAVALRDGKFQLAIQAFRLTRRGRPLTVYSRLRRSYRRGAAGYYVIGTTT
jgi:hypothetical protein